jgi:hypothetical protein
MQRTTELRAKSPRGKGRKVMTENEIAKIIVDCAYKVHCALGPGLLEHIYEVAI